MLIYVTRYALTRGIIKAEGTMVATIPPIVRAHGYWPDDNCFCFGTDAFETRVAAVRDATDRARHAAQYLRDQADELEKLAESPKWGEPPC